MAKVKVSKEVYKSLQTLQNYYSSEQILESHANPAPEWKGNHSCLNSISLLEMSEILILGYEDKTNAEIKDKLKIFIGRYSIADMIHRCYSSNAFKDDPELCDLWKDAEVSIKKVKDYIAKEYNL